MLQSSGLCSSIDKQIQNFINKTMLGMSQQKVNSEGKKISQQPGGRSNFTLKWHSPEPLRQNHQQIRRCKSPKAESNVLRTIQTAGSPRKFCVKIAMPPGGRTTLKIE